MIFGCFQVTGRKCLLPGCFSVGDDSKWGFLAMAIWPGKEHSYLLGKAVGVLRHRWHLVGRGRRRRRQNWTCSSEVSCFNSSLALGFNLGPFCCRAPGACVAPGGAGRFSRGKRSAVFVGFVVASVVTSPVSSESAPLGSCDSSLGSAVAPGQGWALGAPGWFWEE